MQGNSETIYIFLHCSRNFASRSLLSSIKAQNMLFLANLSLLYSVFVPRCFQRSFLHSFFHWLGPLCWCCFPLLGLTVKCSKLVCDPVHSIPVIKLKILNDNRTHIFLQGRPTWFKIQKCPYFYSSLRQNPMLSFFVRWHEVKWSDICKIEVIAWQIENEYLHPVPPTELCDIWINDDCGTTQDKCNVTYCLWFLHYFSWSSQL